MVLEASRTAVDASLAPGSPSSPSLASSACAAAAAVSGAAASHDDAAMLAHDKAASDRPAALPDALRCPLSGKLLDQPVLARDGLAYDRRSFRRFARAALRPSPAEPAPPSPEGKPRHALTSVPHAPLQRYVRDAVAGESAAELQARLTCPITGELFVAPVLLAASQQLYDHDAIRAWLHTSTRDPVCGAAVGEANAMVELHPCLTTLTLSAMAQGRVLSADYAATVQPVRLPGADPSASPALPAEEVVIQLPVDAAAIPVPAPAPAQTQVLHRFGSHLVGYGVATAIVGVAVYFGLGAKDIGIFPIYIGGIMFAAGAGLMAQAALV